METLNITTYARRVADHLGSDADATATVFAIFADAPWTAERRESSVRSSTKSHKSWQSPACQTVQAGS